MKIVFASFCAFASVAVRAAIPEVSDVAYEQDGKQFTTISYTLKNGPAVVTCDVLTNGVSIGQQFLTNMTGAVNRVVEQGENTVIIWDAVATWPGHKIKSGCTVRVTAWPLDNPPDYMVVDLAKEDRDVANRYYECADALPGGLTVTNGPYYLNKLVMRRVHAKDVAWTMGSAMNPGRGAIAEKPHLVTLSNDFYMAVFETTMGQWRMCSDVVPRELSGAVAVDTNRTELPVHYVSFDDIRGASKPWPLQPGGWIGVARERTGIDFDLPSEAQWEFACRSGVGDTKYNTGLGIDIAGSGYNANDASCPGTYNNNQPSSKTTVAGTYLPSLWGFYDMHGNVSEFCIDWWEEDISACSGRPNVNPENPTKTLSGATGTTHPIRGGSYSSPIFNCVPSHRGGDHTSVGPSAGWLGFYGFRVIAPAVAK